MSFSLANDIVHDLQMSLLKTLRVRFLGARIANTDSDIEGKADSSYDDKASASLTEIKMEDKGVLLEKHSSCAIQANLNMPWW